MINQNNINGETIKNQILPIEKSITPNNLLFPNSFKLLSNVTEIFELELAFYEFSTLSKEQLVKRSAYFESIGSEETLHFRMCKNANNSLWKNRSNTAYDFVFTFRKDEIEKFKKLLNSVMV